MRTPTRSTSRAGWRRTTGRRTGGGSDDEGDADCRGRIIPELRGAEGFGYDPLFEIVEYHRTFGELGLTVKAFLSHRSRAIRLILPELERLIDTGAWR